MRADTAVEREKSGQSLVEFALVLPIFMIVMLGAANLGLAIRAQLQLAQVAQQAAQYLVYNPAYADTTKPALLNYMNDLSSYKLTSANINVTVGTSKTDSNACSVSNACVQQDTVSISYPFKLIFPMVGKLSVGLLHNGFINLGANESTVVATDPPGVPDTSQDPNPCIAVKAKHGSSNSCPDASSNNLTVPNGMGEVELRWTPPSVATALGVPLKYCIERIFGTQQDLYYADQHSGFPPANNLYCVTAKSSTKYPSEMYFLDDNNGNGYSDTTGLKYSVLAIQLNGLASKGLAVNQ